MKEQTPILTTTEERHTIKERLKRFAKISPALILAALTYSVSPEWERPQSDNPACAGDRWEHVHDPSRLLPLGDDSCKENVTGTIVRGFYNVDGDWIAWLDVDPEFEYLLNDGNRKGNNGALQIEAICQGRIEEPAPKKTCQEYDETLDVPAVGSRVAVDGWWVYDFPKEHNEIHPVTNIVVLQPPDPRKKNAA